MQILNFFVSSIWVICHGGSDSLIKESSKIWTRLWLSFSPEQLIPYQSHPTAIHAPNSTTTSQRPSWASSLTRRLRGSSCSPISWRWSCSCNLPGNHLQHVDEHLPTTHDRLVPLGSRGYARGSCGFSSAQPLSPWTGELASSSASRKVLGQNHPGSGPGQLNTS